MKKCSNLIYFFIVSLVFFMSFSCTSVHEDRLIIPYMSNANSQETAECVYYEVKVSVGDKLDLAHIGFPTITYQNVEYYGYKYNGTYYYLDSTQGAQSIQGNAPYYFQIDQTNMYFLSSEPISSTSLILNPVYKAFETSPAVSTKPAVHFTYYYNDINGEVKKEEVLREYTASEIAANNITMSSLSLTPPLLSASGKWPMYDKVNTESGKYYDRLFYGYIDPNNYNKAYYYNSQKKFPTDTIEHYAYYRYNAERDEYTIFYDDEPLDVTSVTEVVPCYTPAGFRPVKDYFGTYRTQAGEQKELYLESVFIPGSYNSSWPYEQEYLTEGDIISTLFKN